MTFLESNTTFEPEGTMNNEEEFHYKPRYPTKRYLRTEKLFIESPDYIQPISLNPGDTIRFLHPTPLSPIPLFIQANVTNIISEGHLKRVELICTFSSRRDLVYINKKLTKTISSLVKGRYVKLIKPSF